MQYSISPISILLDTKQSMISDQIDRIFIFAKLYARVVMEE